MNQKRHCKDPMRCRYKDYKNISGPDSREEEDGWGAGLGRRREVDTARAQSAGSDSQKLCIGKARRQSG